MNKIFNALGWTLVIGGIVVGIAAYFVLDSQEFIVALLARVVEEPFAYRRNLALLTAIVIALLGSLIGAIYLGLAELLRKTCGNDSKES